jgi:hypothetical protein
MYNKNLQKLITKFITNNYQNVLLLITTINDCILTKFMTVNNQNL